MAPPLLRVPAEVQSCLLESVPPRHFSCALHFSFFRVRTMASFLIVDEDRNYREALAIALRLDGHRALASGAIDDAQERLATDRFDCCVVDAHLAGADHLLEAAANAGLRTVATGPYAELLAAAAARHPRAELLPKPFRAADLAAPAPGADAVAR